MDAVLDLFSPDAVDTFRAAYDTLADYGNTVIDLVTTTWNSIVIEDAIM